MSLGLACALAACGASSREPTTPEPAAETSTTSVASTAAEPDASEGERSTSQGSTASADLQVYASGVLAAVRRHWSIPATLTPAEAAMLETSVEIRIDDATHLATGFVVREPSGNAIFDESVQSALEALVASREPLPAPPLGLDDRGSIRLRLRGRR
jgi:outer membrane biosynthesis protein TonB